MSITTNTEHKHNIWFI